MNVPIKIETREVAGIAIQTCNARDLWQFVESKRQFADWIKGRIEQYGFVENEDFTVHKSVNGRATVIDYHLTIETAKELAMVENNDKGREVRRYFIECERRAKDAAAIDPLAALSDPAYLRTALLTYTEKVMALEAKVTEQAPKIEALERFSDQDGKHNIRNSAKLIGVPERKLISWLLTHDWFYRDHSGRLCAKSVQIATGYLDTIPVPITRSDGVQTVAQPVITQRGLAKLGELLARDGMLPKPSGVAGRVSRKSITPATQPGAPA